MPVADLWRGAHQLAAANPSLRAPHLRHGTCWSVPESARDVRQAGSESFLCRLANPQREFSQEFLDTIDVVVAMKIECVHDSTTALIASGPSSRDTRKSLRGGEVGRENVTRDEQLNKMLKENRVEWEAALPQPWAEYQVQSDAKKAFGLAETEILTFRYESVPASRKTYFTLADAKVLQQCKFSASALLDLDVKDNLRVLESTTGTGRRCKANFWEMYNDDVRVYGHIYGANGRSAGGCVVNCHALIRTPTSDLFKHERP
ncbi:hypothetical protein FB451DRAFT_1164796 [Mycena latifolia]|nr:hypothetical protein FB451DRAFT_1164796 [Mycena latifolia]